MFRYTCVRVGSGGNVAATPVALQVHANTRSTEATLGSRDRTQLHCHAGHNDLVPDQCKCEILPNFSSIVTVNKWSTMYPRYTISFHHDTLVSWLYSM